MSFPDLAPALSLVRAARRALDPGRALVVGLSGIDGAGKGWVAERLAAAAGSAGLRVAQVGIDGWLALPEVRFSEVEPAAHFYRHAFRWEALFGGLVRPLRERRSVRIEVDHLEETAGAYRRKLWEFHGIEVVLLEGIFLFKRELQREHDVRIWVECTERTALERAIARSQEGLAPEETARAYHRIYFPAQRLHALLDAPRAAAHLTVVNDPRWPGYSGDRLSRS